MSVRLSSESLVAALAEQVTRVDTATAIAVESAGLVLERSIKAKITGGHKKGTKTGATPGGPPQNISGTLRRSISTGSAFRVGDGIYGIEVGPTVVYGRAVDQGIHGTQQVAAHSRTMFFDGQPYRSRVSAHTRKGWPAGVSYPYVEPGARDAMDSGAVSAVFHSAWARAITL